MDCERLDALMKPRIAYVVSLLLAAASMAEAAGPLLTTDKPGNPQPLRWDTTQGPIKVYTDIGDFAYQSDGTVFLNNDQADRITAFALTQWSNVATCCMAGST